MMGCVSTKPFFNETDEKTSIFKVVNIDQDGNGHYPGKIEITSENLLLYQNKKEPLSWPIRSLRRYGVENNIFSFEVGRRCPTGEGIFAFRCEQAEQLFRLLQTNIQRSSNNSNPTHNDPVQPSNYLEPRAVHLRQFRLESVGSAGSYPHTPISPSQQSNVYNFELADIDKSKFEKKNSNSLDTNFVGPPSPVYINVPPNGSDAENPNSSQTVYIYMTENGEKDYPAPLVLPASHPDDEAVEHSPKNLQYTTLYFDDNQSSPVVKTPTEIDELGSKYTTIDLQRTWALSQSTKPNIENDIGCTRRTRHNSNLFGVYR